MNYRPDNFEQLYREQGGKALWDYLREHDTLLRLETASYLGRPAVEAISPGLRERFGGAIAQHRIKRMIGHMVRQIMEARGYTLDRSGVTIRRHGNVFYSGSRYRRDPLPAG